MRTIAALAAMLIAGTGAATAAAPNPDAAVSLIRLDCGSAMVGDFDAFFSDSHELPVGPRKITDSCYLIRHGDRNLLWDTGFPAAIKGQNVDMGGIVATLAATLPEQLVQLGLKPSDIEMVGISHMHDDHTGQAASFPAAQLIIGQADFEMAKGAKDPFGPWRAAGAKVKLTHGGDVDLFGDGSVIALNTPGHTPDHMSLLIKLASGNVLLTGDLYHSTLARSGRQVPGFNTSRAETLASMDRFERLAKSYRAKVIIQHEPADIAKLPAFPAAAQ